MRFLRSRSGQKTVAVAIVLSPFCRDTGPDVNRAGVAHPAQIYWRHLRRAEVTGHLEAQDASLIYFWRSCTDVRHTDWHVAHELAMSEVGTPLSRLPGISVGVFRLL